MKKDKRGYLSDLLLHIERILEATDDGYDVFAASWLIQDAVIRNFEVMGEIVKRLGKSFAANHPEVPWRSIASFRDVMIHDYEDLHLEIIWQTIAQDLPPLREAIVALLATLPPEVDDE
jgi:uncharacterized protein with HEPN domain